MALIRSLFACLLSVWLVLPSLSWGQSTFELPQRVSLTGRDTAQFVKLPVPKQLIKAGINLPLFRHSSVAYLWTTVGVDVALERKLVQGLTFIAGVETNVGVSRGAQLYTVELPIGLRYYFPVGKQMKQRMDAHSFFSPYFGFQTHSVLLTNLRYSSEAGASLTSIARNYSRGQYVPYRTNSGNLTETFNMLQYTYFLAGAQFKLSHANYLDVNAVLPISFLIYHKADYTLFQPALVTIKYGIWW